jgi:hypothetical protein
MQYHKGYTQNRGMREVSVGECDDVRLNRRYKPETNGAGVRPRFLMKDKIEEKSGCINCDLAGASRSVIFTCVAAEAVERSCAKQPCWVWRTA